MNILSSLAPLSTLQVGIRALSRHPDRICASATRQFSTAFRSTYSQACCNYSARVSPNPSCSLSDPRYRFRQLLPRTAVRTAVLRIFRAITHYADLPDDYEDAKGLPFRREDLNQREVYEIFGPLISAAQANTLLKIIHGRRVAGTLDDPDLQRNTANFRPEEKLKALEYLREHIPVDEVINAGLRAEDELSMLEEAEAETRDAEQQFEETSPQKTPSKSEPKQKEDIPTGRLPKKTKGDSVYGEGAFDRIRKRNEALYAEEQRRLEEERQKKEEEEALQNTGTLQTQQAKPREMSAWRKKHYEAATSDLKEPPDMPASQRLLPWYTLAVLAIGLSIVCASLYKPPRKSWRLWPDIPPAAATCMGLVMINMAIFSMWKVPPLWKLMNRYMILVPATPVPLALVFSMFSHQAASHLFGNMIVLWFFGVRLHDEIGRGNFVALYLSSGILGHLLSATHIVFWRGLSVASLGASGAIYGIISAYLWEHRFDEFKIFGYPPDPTPAPQGLAFLGLIIAVHIWLAFLSKSPAAAKTDVASHIGGIIGGILGMELVRKQLDNKARIRAEKMKTMGMLDKGLELKRATVKPGPLEADSKSKA